MTTAHVFIAISLDGFIARPNGDIGWLLQRDDPAEDHGYTDFIADKDVIVMGRGSFETVAAFDPWPYELPVIVLSRQLTGTAVPAHLEGKVRFCALAPQELMEEQARQGVRRIYVDGGQVVQSFLKDRLIDDMVITTVPVLIGSGRSLFGELAQDVDLELVASRSFPSGLVQSTYRVVR
ncbi:dihydrofolate reductase family protein [Massilia agilis]|uniref:Dihydrofolate reductase family protein n=1 Tax=Massilia agilis TaxID=1811226 RepID=A0ABT2DBP8_9BURK|nr:dihydrofolate reductase family protein [Massilia agilis]MCS0808702.1 dihydrofolate reductase family protein [Massilia agilis]